MNDRSNRFNDAATTYSRFEMAKKDYKFLSEFREVDDLVSVENCMFELMENPTRKAATELFISAIGLWAQEHFLEGEKLPPECEVIMDFYGHERRTETHE